MQTKSKPIVRIVKSSDPIAPGAIRLVLKRSMPPPYTPAAPTPFDPSALPVFWQNKFPTPPRVHFNSSLGRTVAKDLGDPLIGMVDAHGKAILPNHQNIAARTIAAFRSRFGARQ